MKQALFALAVLGMAASAGTIEITNDTGSWDIYYAYISPSTSDEWGSDWLGSEIMSVGETWEFPVTNGTWDIKLVDEDGDEYILYDVPVSGTWSWYVTLDDLGEYYYSSSTTVIDDKTGVTTGGGSAPVTIYNDLGSWTIYYAYCNPSSTSDWGSDRLGSSTIVPGDSYTFYVPAGDYYDIYCQDEDGDTYTLWEVWIDASGFYWSVDLGDID